MRKNPLLRARMPIACGLFVILAGLTAWLPAAAPRSAEPGELIVRFQHPLAVATGPAGRSLSPAERTGLAPSRALAARGAAAFETAGPRASVRALDAQFGLASARPVYTPGMLAPQRAAARAAQAPPTGAADIWVLRFAEGADLEKARAAYARDPEVRYAEYNRTGTLAFVPSDTLYPQTRSNLALVGMEAAWDVQRGVTPDLVVAVIDSGVDPSHHDLADALDRPASFNFADLASSTTIFDDQGHGTRVAGEIGAIEGNGIGIAGVAFGCTLISLDVANSSGVVNSADVASAINWAVDQGAKVANLSLRFTASTQTLLDACTAADKAGVLLVAASGNENQGDEPVYPASYDMVIGVAATMDDGVTRAPFSNYNGQNDSIAKLAAPGMTIYSTVPGSQYNGSYGSGTSFAAPIVSGVAALLRAAHPFQSVQAIRAHLLATATPLGSWAGAGRVNAAAALTTPMTPDVQIVSVVVDDSPALFAANDGSGVFGPGEQGRLIVTLTSNGADASNVTAILTSTSPDAVVPGSAVSFGHVARNSNVSNVAVPFGPVAISPTAVSTQIAFNLQILDPLDGYSVTRTFTLPIEQSQDISGTVTDKTFQSGKTYHVTGALTLAGLCTVQAGARFKVEPAVDIALTTGVSFSTHGTVPLPNVFTSSKPFGYTGTNAQTGPSPRGPIGPQTEPVPLTDYAHVLYVDGVRGSFGNPGTPTSPMQTILEAWASVTTADDSSPTNRYAILIAEGTYNEGGYQLPDYTDIYGGFEGSAWTRDIAAHRTVVDAPALPGGPIFWAGQLSRVDGLVMTHGSELFFVSGAIFVQSGLTVRITNNVFYDNAGTDGAALVCGDTSATIRNNLIWNSDAGAPPGSAVWLGHDAGSTGQVWFTHNIVGACTASGIYCDTGMNGLIDDNLIVNNGDSGISLLACSPTINANWIAGNTAFQGGGIFCSAGAAPRIVNNEIAANTATSSLGDGGGAIYIVTDANPTIYNNSFGGNTDQGGGGIISIQTSATVVVKNCVLNTDNATPAIVVGPGFPQPIVSNCDINGGWSGPGAGNFDQNQMEVGDIAWGAVVDDTFDPVTFTTTLTLDSSDLLPHALAQRILGIESNIFNVYDVFTVVDNTPGTITIWGQLAASSVSAATSGAAQSRRNDPAIAPGATQNRRNALWVVPNNRLTAKSPCRDAGVGPGTDPNVPATDMDGRPRTGATCDVGPTQFAPLTGFGPWGRFLVPGGATSTSFQHCVFENGDGVQIFADAALGNCVFRRNANDALQVFAGSAPLPNLTADHNQGAGIVAPGHNLTNCSASYNEGNGLEGAGLTSCTALSNLGGGLIGTTAVGCSADQNTSSGCTVQTQATGVLARGNGLDGIVMMADGSAVDCVALGNGSEGFKMQGTNSTLTNCVAAGNLLDGAFCVGGGNGGAVVNSRINQNGGYGVEGFASVTDSQILGNAGAAITSATVFGCYVSGNGAGLVGAKAVGFCYIAGNGDAGADTLIVGGVTVTSSTIVRNAGDGVRNALLVNNCWVAGNGGRGVLTADSLTIPRGLVTKSSVQDNLMAGFYNQAQANANNVFGNGLNELPRTGLVVPPRPWVDAAYHPSFASPLPPADYTNCYWGVQNTAELTSSAANFNVSFVLDGHDGLSSDTLNLWPYASVPVPGAPNFSVIPPFLASVSPGESVSRNVGLTTFTLVYSQPMQTMHNPSVTFGTADPFTGHIVEPAPGWVSTTTWQGIFTVQSDTGDGLQTIRIADARAASGFFLADDVTHGFTVDTSTSGALAANNGLASASGDTMDVQWSADGLPAGAEGFNVSRSDSDTPGTFDVISDSLIPASLVMRRDRAGRLAPAVQFNDARGLAPAKTYWYVVQVVDAGGNASQWTPPFFGTTNSFPVSAPTVVNRPASRLTGIRATLGGTIEQTGGEDPDVKIYWGLTDGVDQTANWDNVEDLGTVNVGDFSQQLTQLAPNTTYFFRCQAENSHGVVWAIATATFGTTAGSGLTPPTGLAASDGTFKDHVGVTWNASLGAAYYEVSRADSATGDKTPLGPWQMTTTYDDFSVTTGTIYYYFVRAATDAAGAGASPYSAFDTGYSGTPSTVYLISFKGCNLSIAGTSMTLTNTNEKSSVKIALLKKPPKSLTEKPGTKFYSGGPLGISADGSFGKISSQAEIMYLGVAGTLGSVSTQGCVVDLLQAAAVKSVKMAAAPNSTGAAPLRLWTRLRANGAPVPSAFASLSVSLTGIGLQQLDTPGQAASVKVASKTGKDKASKQAFVSLADVGTDGMRVGDGLSLALTGGNVLGPVVTLGAIKSLSVKTLSANIGGTTTVFGGTVGAPGDFPATPADLPTDPTVLAVHICTGETQWVAANAPTNGKPLALMPKIFAGRGIFAYLMAGYDADASGQPILDAPTFAGTIGSLTTATPDPTSGALGLWGFVTASASETISLKGDTTAITDGQLIVTTGP